MTLENFNVAVPTAFNENNEELDTNATLQHINNLAQQGVKSVVVSGSTGEQHSMSTDERLELINALENNNELPKGLEIIFGIASTRLANAVKLARGVANSKRIKAVLLGFPPYILPSQEEAIQYVKTVLGELGDKQVILYNNPHRTGFDLKVESIIELAKEPQIVGLKESGNPEKVITLKEQLPADFSFMIGGDANLFAKKSLGFNSLSSVLGNLDPELMETYFNQLEAEPTDEDQARELQQRFNRVAAAVTISKLKNLLSEDISLNMGVGRAPLGM